MIILVYKPIFHQLLIEIPSPSTVIDSDAGKLYFVNFITNHFIPWKNSHQGMVNLRESRKGEKFTCSCKKG